jgi:hypothetical protein
MKCPSIVANSPSRINGVPGAGNVTLAVYDLPGREAAALVNERKTPGQTNRPVSRSNEKTGVPCGYSAIAVNCISHALRKTSCFRCPATEVSSRGVLPVG